MEGPFNVEPKQSTYKGSQVGKVGSPPLLVPFAVC
jgi:hypothetical protein